MNLDKKEVEKPKLSKEEIANFYKNYYNWLKTVYPVEDFNISGKDGEKLYFYRGYPNYRKEQGPLIYYLRDEKFKEFEKQIMARNLRGEESKNEEESDVYRDRKASIIIDKKDKKFKFSVKRDYQGNGYGRAIYENCSKILDILGIQDKEEYKIQVLNRADHKFLKKMHTEELVARTKSEPSAENAIEILRDFAQYPNTVKLSDVNTIVDYAKKSNVSVQEIAQALNENKFNIFTYTIEDEDLEQFRTFGITGLKATCMHEHFMKDESFEFLKLITDADKEDTTLEFRRVFEKIKKQHEESEKEGKYMSDNLKQFGEFGHIILDWQYPELLFRDLTPEIQELVRGQAINNFDKFDPDHKNYKLRDDENTDCTYRVLSEAGLMDKNTYIALYQKALNRNYNLAEFDQSIYHGEIDEEARKEARQEIFQNAYYPYPKKSWQKSRSWEEGHRISKVAIPQELIQRGEVRNRIKQEIIKQGIARKTKIKTDMAGIGKDGKPFVVDNLKDWLFGVPGAHGNLQMMGTDGVAFPPQTPEFAIKMVEQVLEDLTYPCVSGRGE